MGLSSDLDNPDASLRRAMAVPTFHQAHFIQKRDPTMIKTLLVTTALSCVCALSQATVVNGDFTNVGGIAWTVDIKVTNDGTLPLVGDFTVYFDYGSASNLVLVSSPATWDTLVLQPDDGLASAGYLDSLPLDAGNKLSSGQAISGYRVQFDWSAAVAPNSFVYTINDDSFNALESGTTTATSAPIPEPASYALLAFGLLGISAFAQSRRTAA